MPSTSPSRHSLDLLALLDETYPDAHCALDHRNPFELVVATILSAQCTDARVNLTTPALFARFPTPEALAKADLAELEGLIRSTGFFRNKAKNLLGLAQALLSRHQGQVPSSVEALAALPGVGQKTANVVLANAFGVPALAVDTHIFRVARRLGLSQAKTPEKVEEDLTRLFPRDRWIPLHHQLIWHGRRVCDARKPNCRSCPLLNLCPTGTGTQVDPHTGHPVAMATKRPEPLVKPAAPRTAHGPQRIVSLVPSITELLSQWGLVDRLVGRTHHCIAPHWIRNTLPAVGGTKDPDLEAIRALTPDLVLLEREENTLATFETLEGWGLPTRVLSIRSLEDVRAGWLELGETLGVKDLAEARAKTLDTLMKKPRRKRLRILILVWRNPWIAAGSDTYLSDLARHAGFDPVASPGWPHLDEKELRALDPEVVILPTEPFRFTKRHAGELASLLPRASLHIMDGQALTWMLSRTEEGLAKLRTLRDGL